PLATAASWPRVVFPSAPRASVGELGGGVVAAAGLTRAPGADSPPFLSAREFGVIWEKPDGSLPAQREAVEDSAVFGPRTLTAGPLPFDPVCADGSPSRPFAPSHFPAIPSADWISETSIWSCSFERTST